MNTRPLLAATLAALSMLTACGGGGATADEETAQARVRTASVDSSGVATPAIGGIGGSGVTSDIGGIGGSGVTSNIGGIGGSGVTSDIGGIGGSGVAAPAIGGIGGSGIAAVAPAAACGVTGVDVTIAGVRLNQSATADAAGDGWFDVALAAPLRVNLLALSTGAALPFDVSALPDGTYSQVRLLLVVNDATTPLADALVSAAGVESALAVPGATQGGLRLAATIAVSGGQASGSWTAAAVCQALGLGTATTD